MPHSNEAERLKYSPELTEALNLLGCKIAPGELRNPSYSHLESTLILRPRLSILTIDERLELEVANCWLDFYRHTLPKLKGEAIEAEAWGYRTRDHIIPPSAYKIMGEVRLLDSGLYYTHLEIFQPNEVTEAQRRELALPS